MRLVIATRGIVIEDLEPAEVADLRRQLGDTLAESGQSDSCGLIDAAEVAKRLGVSREYVYDHAEDYGGQKVGRAWRFNPANLRRDSARSGPRGPEAQSPPKRRRRKPRSRALLEVKGDRNA